MMFHKRSDSVDICDRIKQVRKHFGYSQTKLGELLGVSRDVVNNLENSRLKRPEQKEPLYQLLCQKLDVDEHWLRTGEGIPFPETADNVLQFSAAHPNMSDVDKTLMEAYFSLSEDQKEVFLQYCLRVAEVWSAQNNKKNTAAARSGDRVEVAQVSKEAEDAVLPPEYTGDI